MKLPEYESKELKMGTLYFSKIKKNPNKLLMLWTFILLNSNVKLICIYQQEELLNIFNIYFRIY